MPKNNAREQIIAQLKESENILVTVNNSPNVDELAAALALTLAINKTGKHATAVASGDMPDALEFLKPNKTFENSVDSLRDFIIALNKDKADHLRYKLVGDHVKIFITPYRTTISEQDLEFEQGDFNVDFVLAIGVRDKDHLDGALSAHGRILHDASVGVLTVGENPSNLSELNWHEPDASSISEMVLELIESDSIGKKSLTEPVATAILTGIVAETDRFSNEKTSAKVMNIASKLILAGADQQLVVSKLKESEAKTDMEQASEPVIEQVEISKDEEPAEKDHSVLTIERDQSEQIEESSPEPTQEPAPKSSELENLEAIAVDFPAVGPAPEVQTEVQPEVEIQQSIQPEVQSEEPLNFEAAPIVSPAENITPEIPAPMADFSGENAFVAEQPVQTTTFEPASQTEISTEQSEIQPAPNQPEAPMMGARDYVAKTGDDYYHPQTNRNYVEEIAQNSQILSHDNSGGQNIENTSVLPETNAYSEAPTIQPLTMGVDPQNSSAQMPAQDFGGFPPPPPLPNFDGMMPPELPPIADFGQIPPMMEVSAPQIQQTQPVPDVAQGTAASANNIMTDQIYQDPAQFKIPGM